MVKNKILRGIGGWLILPTIGFILSAIMLIYYTLSFLPYISEPYVSIFFILYGSMSFFFVSSLIFEFKKLKEFPKWAVFTMWYAVIVSIGLAYFINDYTDLSTTIISAMIWTWYFKVSKRVKNTFVN